MWTIKDYVVGEVVETTNRENAIINATHRVKLHNSEFNYSHRGKHLNANCSMDIDEDKKVIYVK